MYPHEDDGDDGLTSASEDDALLPASALPAASFERPRLISRRVLAVVCGLVAGVVMGSLAITAGGSSSDVHDVAGSMHGKIAQKWSSTLPTQTVPTQQGSSGAVPSGPGGCHLTVEALKGDTVLQAQFTGLATGDFVLIGDSESTGERRRIVDFDPFSIDLPLRNNHAAGTSCDAYDKPFPRAGPPQTTGGPMTTPNWALWYATSVGFKPATLAPVMHTVPSTSTKAPTTQPTQPPTSTKAPTTSTKASTTRKATTTPAPWGR